MNIPNKLVLADALHPVWFNGVRLQMLNIAHTMEDEEPVYMYQAYEGEPHDVVEQVLDDAHNAWVAGWTTRILLPDGIVISI